MVLTRKMNLENSPHLVVPDPAVLDMLYGTKSDQLYLFIRENEEEAAKDLLTKPDSFWLDLMNVTFSRPRVMTKARMDSLKFHYYSKFRIFVMSLLRCYDFSIRKHFWLYVVIFFDILKAYSREFCK